MTAATRRVVIALLALGVVTGYGSAFAHWRAEHRAGWHCHCDGRDGRDGREARDGHDPAELSRPQSERLP